MQEPKDRDNTGQAMLACALPSRSPSIQQQTADLQASARCQQGHRSRPCRRQRLCYAEEEEGLEKVFDRCPVLFQALVKVGLEQDLCVLVNGLQLIVRDGGTQGDILGKRTSDP